MSSRHLFDCISTNCGPNLTVIRPPTTLDVSRLLLVSALWGTSFLCIAIALADFSPLAIAAWRVILATIAILGICALRKVKLPRERSVWLLFLAIGMLNSAVPFTLIGWGQQSVDSATTAILIATTPFSTLLMSHWMTGDDKITRFKLLGLLLGFAGVVVLLGHDAVVNPGSALGMMVILFAASCYSLSSLLIRKLSHLPTFAIVGGSLITSCFVLVPALVWLHPPWQQSASNSAWFAVVFLAAGPTAAAYLLRAEIVKLNGAVFMSNAGFLIPLFAVLWAWLLLNEWPAPTTWVAMVLILAGVGVGRYRAHYLAVKPSGQ